MVLGDDRQQALARLGQGRKGLQRFEGHRQAATVALVLVALTGGRHRRGRSGTTLEVHRAGLLGLWLRLVLCLWF
jgi:hypothetical protein